MKRSSSPNVVGYSEHHYWRPGILSCLHLRRASRSQSSSAATWRSWFSGSITILHQCAGFCKLAHFFCSIPCSQAMSAHNTFDCNICSCFSRCTAVDTSNQAWQQAELGLSRDGLGMCSLSHHSPAAYCTLPPWVLLALVHPPNKR